MGILESLAQSTTSISSSNPFVQAMNSTTQTDISLAEQGRIGSILRNHKIVSGDGASIIDATLDYFLKDSYGGPYSIDTTLLKSSASSKQFIPIVIKTEHTYKTGTYINDDSTKTHPLYIIFDSTPDSITFSKNAEWNARQIQGRPEPVQVFAASGPTTISLTGDFFVSSKYEHVYKLKVSDYLMSLATPSKYNYMPSPVIVTIGEWKKFRAVVNNVSIEFKGPWMVTPSLLDTTSGTKERKAWAESENKKMSDIQSMSIPTHAPYMFTATISLTLVSEKNYVNFAEDVINPTVDAVNKEDYNNIENILKISGSLQNQSDYVQEQLKKPGPYNSWRNPGSEYRYSNGVLYEFDEYADLDVNSNFNMFEQSNLDRQRADLASITHIVNQQLVDFLRGVI